ncbi:hypothetical protein XENTR_v10011329 [Xenopus tropicalis]|uniref:Uncharacterized protein LOC100490257 isoform X4 n=1 Tax=Xenopus tropicalis TaxID=8364 RepID=A0A8J1JHT6_XENTR|nr:uncharacterized protein LOC100490257 isoform X4 [Xenopus tropicalis]KAE8607919.1 hypothetical protein XENTR_v10011329 [Xenopus tropicalis]
MALLLFLILGNTLYFVVSDQTSPDSNHTPNSISTASTHHGQVVTTPFTPEPSTISLITQGDTTLSTAAPTHQGHVVTTPFTPEPSTTSLVTHGDITTSIAASTHHGHVATASFTAEHKTSLHGEITSSTAELSKPTIKCQRVNNTWVEIICLSVSVTPPITYNVLRNNISYNTVNQQGAMPEKILIPLTSGSKVELLCKAQKGSVTKYSDPLLICEDEASNKEPEKSTEDQGARHLINISRLITSWGREKETYIILKVCVPIIILTLCLFIFVTIFCYKEKNVKYQV